jgi:hypothetical protein
VAQERLARDAAAAHWTKRRRDLHRRRQMVTTSERRQRPLVRPFQGMPTIQRRRESFLDKTEIQRIEAYLRQKFQLPSIIVRQRPQKDDSAEVNIGDEFIGVIFKDEEEGEVSYAFNMAILDIDLP